MATGWKMDESGNIILFRLPKDLQIVASTSEIAKTNIATIPRDIVLEILDRLDLTDRVCLALTCKSLAFSINDAPRLPLIQKPPRWPRRSIAECSSDKSAEPEPLYLMTTPEWYTLVPRLAKGWIPKDKFKYCWKCNKNYPREWTFYQNKLSKQHPPGWLWKLTLTEKQWKRLSLQQRHDHMIAHWLAEHDDTLGVVRKVYYPDLGIRMEYPDQRGPECPLCLERELLFCRQELRSLFFRVNMSVKLIGVLLKMPVHLFIAAAEAVGGVLHSR